MSEPSVDHVLDIANKLARLSPIPSERCIYRVHDHLRKENKNAYEPEVVAIGPYHHGKDKLQPMEEHKLHYLQQLLERRNEGVESYVVAMQELQERAREFYAEPISSLDSNKFVEMMLLDSCFIIELFRKCEMEELRDKDDPIFQLDHIQISLRRDLMLFENQLPFFILVKFFNMTEISDSRDNIVGMFLSFSESTIPGKFLLPPFGNLEGIKHLLDLVHQCCCNQFHSVVSQNIVQHEDKAMKSATELMEAGIKFKKFEERIMFDIKFVKGTMEIPILQIQDITESFLRNLIAYEQYLNDTSMNYFTAYMKFMDYLVNSSKDVEILSHNGIINNLLGGNEVVSTMFNNLGNNVFLSLIYYHEVYHNVNEHCRGIWNLQLAILRRKYFNTPWALISFVAAVVLLLLTVAQIVFSILSFKKSF